MHYSMNRNYGIYSIAQFQDWNLQRLTSLKCSDHLSLTYRQWSCEKQLHVTRLQATVEIYVQGKHRQDFSPAHAEHFLKPYALPGTR